MTLAKDHHTVPTFYLRGFAGPNGKLGVARLRPKPRWLGERRPERIGVVRHLNSVLLHDGTRDDSLERGPTARLDSAGAEAVRELLAFADAVEPPGALRLLDWTVEERVPVYTLVAGLMVRGTALRNRFDETSLPTLLAEMNARLDEHVASGETDPAIASVLREAFSTPGRVQLSHPENRHQAALLPLMESVTAALGSTFVIGVRRLPGPMLTGSEPVILFQTADITAFNSFAELVANDPTIRLWDERPALKENVIAAVSKLAAILVPVSSDTVMLLFDPDKDDGCKFTYLCSQVSAEGLGDLVSIATTARSEWVAGPPGCELLRIIRDFAERAR